MVEDIYIKNILDGFCLRLKAGLLCTEGRGKIEYADKVRTVNANAFEECVYSPVQSPSIVCFDGTQEIDDEYKFIIGDPIATMNILYGFYDLNPGVSVNPSSPNATDLAADITANAANYTSTPWIPTGIDANIIHTTISYHLVRIPNSLPTIQIIDEGGVKVNSAWTMYSDANYNYYLLEFPVAPTDIHYTIKE